MVIEGFMEDWDGEIVISDIRNFNDEKNFIEQAEKYVKDTRGFRVPVLSPTILEIVYNSEQEECWMSKKYALKTGFEGEIVTVYMADLDWENTEG